MAKLKKGFRKATAVFMSSLVAVSALSTGMAMSASAVSYSEMSALDQYAYSGNDLGANYSKSSTTFKVWAPTASNVKLKRYKTGSDSESGAAVIGTTDMTKGSQGIWSATVSGDLAGTYYTYLVTVNGTTKETVDIYAKSTGVNGMRGMVIDLDATDPDGWDNDTRVSCKNQTDAVIWEAHVRDFSASSDSGMKNKGKYLAFTETGTTVNNDGIHPTGIDYLEDLGVTHVHLLPVYDYGSVDETKLNTDQFNWGYDPMNYNTPEGSYSTDPYHGEVRVKEFKQMVQSLHKKNIGVVMDVVYNHTYAGNSNINDWFNYTVPDYYYRQNSKGTFSNASGCGNETASDRAMYQKFMVDSLKYWATEYHLDGFRFDLMGIHDTDTMNLIRAELDKINPDILIYGEPWTAEATPCPKTTAVQGNMKYVSEEVAAFNDKVRDAIKGSCFNATDKGFIQGVGYEEALKGGIQASSTTMSGDSKWSKQPSQTVTYTSAHDNYTLYDKLVKSCGGSFGQRRDDLVQMNKMAGGIILTSQGMSFWQAGEEFARSKGGDENSYKSATSVNQLTWQNTITYSDIVSYYKGLIEIRKAYAPFRDPTNTSNGTIYFSWGTNCPSNVVAFTMYNKNSTGNEWNYAAVIHNANSVAKQVTLMTYDDKVLPSQWVIVADGTNAGVTSLGTTGSIVTVPARSTMVLIDKTSFDNTVLSKKSTVTVNHVIKDTGAVYKTETLTGEEGASYSTSSLSEMLNKGYKLSSTSGSTSGVFSSSPITVTYYYELDTSKYSTVTVKYVDKSTQKEISSADIFTGMIGDSYSFTAKSVSGYELAESSSSVITGKYASTNTTVTFFYDVAEVQGLKIHYYNSNSWSTVCMYVYSGSGSSAKLYSGAWPGTKMTSDGNNWYSGTVDGAESALFIANNNNNGSQDPSGVGSTGYSVSGEVWVKNGKVYQTGKVTVNYVSTDGKVLGKEVMTGIADGTTSYTTSPKTFEGYTLKETPQNASGVYTSSAITVTYTYQSSVAELVNNSTIASTRFEMDDGTTITASASGGTAPYKYALYTSIDGSSWTKIQDYTTISKAITFKPTSTNIQYVKVSAKDSNGTVADKTLGPLTITISGLPLQNNSSLESDSITLGQTVTIKGAAKGYATPFRYAYYYKKSTSSSWTTIGSGFTTNTTATFKPGSAVDYDVKVKVSDSSGRIVAKALKVYVHPVQAQALENNSKLSSTSVAKGEKVTITGKASGGTSPYTYTYQYKKASSSTWTTIGDKYTDTTSASFKPGSGVPYVVRVIVKDKVGKTAKKDIDLNVSSVSVLVNSSKIVVGSNTYDNSEVITSNVGDKITLKAKASGGTGGYTYALMYKKASSSTWTKIGTKYGTESTGSFTPKSITVYDIMINVKDSNGTVKSLSYKLDVCKSGTLPVNKSYVSATKVKVGTKVVMTGKAEGGEKPYSYAFYYNKSGSNKWTIAGNEFETSNTASFTPQTKTTYNIRIAVIDANYNYAEKSFAVVVE